MAQLMRELLRLTAHAILNFSALPLTFDECLCIWMALLAPNWSYLNFNVSLTGNYRPHPTWPGQQKIGSTCHTVFSEDSTVAWRC